MPGTVLRRLGVDTGGTFTDVVLQTRGADGRLQVKIHKLLSTPEDPSLAIARGVEQVLDAPNISTGRSARPDISAHLIHGTTVATNALLQRRGARVAFVTTAGFEDLLTLRRQDRPELYRFDVQLPAPLVGSEACYGVRERVGWDGQVLQALSDVEIARIIAKLEAGEPFEAVSVCLLHAYANPAHEARLGQALRAHFESMHVSLSHEVLPEFREYERAATTSVNAFVGPVMARYLTRLQTHLAALKERAPIGRVEILQSSGGRTELDYAAKFPVHTILSGPAGGVVGARAAALELGIERIITFDMGGTSSDVSLCDAEINLSGEADVSGLPVRVPAIDIQTVGAGGGSIAWVDPGGALRVGPKSAGADPGPAAYGRGGVQPTVTDAHIYLGRVLPEYFLGGAMTLDLQAARRAIDTLADSLGLSGPETARGILDIADANMMRAIKVISLERGHDPRDFCLVAFGGAGGMHACRLAEKMDIKRVLIPQNPGILSANGMLNAESQRLYSRTILRPLAQVLAPARPSNASPAEETDILRQTIVELTRQARQDLLQTDSDDDSSGQSVALAWSVDLRYQAQSFELNIPVDWSLADDSVDAELDDPTEAFERLHQEVYGYRADGRPVELVTMRLRAFIPREISADAARAAEFKAASETEDSPETAPINTNAVSATSSSSSTAKRQATEKSQTTEENQPTGENQIQVDFGHGLQPCAHLQRHHLRPGDRFLGPALVTEYSGTILIEPGWRAQIYEGHLLAERNQ